MYKSMDIIYLGHSSFKLKGKNGSVITDPYDSQMVGLKFTKTEADIITVSHHHPDHDKLDQVPGYKKVVDGPGDYEIMGVSIIGLPSFHDDKKGEERGKNTIYVFEMDGLRLCHLGDLGHVLPEGTLSALGDIDVLMIPVGGGYTIGPADALHVVQQIEPSVVIPMHYKVEGLSADLSEKLESVDTFVKEIGLTAETLPKLSISKDLLSEDQKLYILEKK